MMDPSPPARIVCDYRERRSEVYLLLRDRDDVSLEIACLDAGDYIVEGCVTVERKSWNDLLLSLRTGRLFRQAAALKRGAERPILLVEGVGALDAPRLKPSLRGAVTSLSVMWYLPVLWAADPVEAADLLATVGRQWNCDRRETWAPPLRRPKRGADLRVPMLRHLPGVGPGLARRMLDHFGSVRAICEASPKELSAVRGIGRKRAAAIHHLLGGPVSSGP
jgi:Fanconi anemia group M protein